MAKKTKKNLDGFVVFIRFMDVITWSIIFAAMMFLEKARPQTKTILDIRYSKNIRNTWDLGLAQASLWLFVVAAIIAMLGLLINLGFLGDKKHHMSYGLLIGFIVSFGASIAYIYLLM